MRLPDGGNLRLRCSLGGGFAARATITPLALGDQSGWLMNVSFGTGATRLLRSGKLEEADFPATDMSAEILSLSAAKSAAMATGLRLNRRLRGAWSAAEKLANTDALTGLQNRRALQDTLCRLRQSPVPFAAVHLDLDHFKQVNDNFGHAAGDFALQHVAGILRQELRSEDTIVRQGGDEFVLILIGSQTRDDLSAMARRLIFQIAQPFEFKGKQRFVTASMGIACSGDSGAADPDQLLRDADVALYAAKDAGRNGFRFFDP
jgi:diguanylate cyclase (GGDEF)-like protein